MNILIHIGHPAHVHLFKHAIWCWNKRGHKTLVAAQDKDIALVLLNHYKIPYKIASSRRNGLLRPVAKFWTSTVNLIRLSKQFHPDIVISVGSPMAAWASAFMRVPYIAFEDTEHVRVEQMLFKPASKLICTPSCFKHNLGPKQYRYDGFHELAYLHPNWFTPNSDVLTEIGLTEQDKYFIVRFVSFQAIHDIRLDLGGFSYSGKLRLVAELQKLGRVIITSEGPMPAELESLRMPISPTKIHDLLYYSSLFIGEGGTMPSEAAMLGVPSIQVRSTLKEAPGTHAELEQKYGLVHRITQEQDAIELAVKLANNLNARPEYQQRRKKMLADKIDVTTWLVNLVENYPDIPSGRV